MLHIMRKTDKPCVVCLKEKQTVEAKFQDQSFSSVCWKDLWKMFEARSKNSLQGEKHEQTRNG